MRAFFAVDLPEKVKDQLASLQRQSQYRRNIKWVERDNLHLTLLFLGDISPAQEKRLFDTVPEAVRDIGEFSFSLSGLGAFPNDRKPKVLWVGVKAPGELYRLREALVQTVRKTGISVKDDRFHPHITLGRVKRDFYPLNKIFPGIRSVAEENVTLSSFVLIESTLTPQGPVYKVKKRFCFS
ncbi:MAG: RNA 2',3'-cyclic phosphodiesterase [Thermoanaerobacteraceae bacterium]|nr:RNA 2',3'-cyclic phosphodiesterase [Thermoanaerobacteraceae bacterium]